MIKMMKIKDKIFKNFIIAIIFVFIYFFTLAFIFWYVEIIPLHLFIFLSIGIFMGTGGFLYAVLPSRWRWVGKKISFIMIFILMFCILGIRAKQNLQIEGFFFSLTAGLYTITALHYLVAKIVGPLVFQRGWCGWGCWTIMILDFLPYKRSSGRLAGKWELLRYLHFLLSFSLVLIFYIFFRQIVYENDGETIAIWWFLIGNGLYYVVGITAAVLLKDNRAFCKYWCPVAVILKIPAIFSFIKISGSKDKCSGCQRCRQVCPMDIRIYDYIKSGRRVLSTECVLCLECIHACSNSNLRASIGFDIGGVELLKMREKVEAALAADRLE